MYKQLVSNAICFLYYNPFPLHLSYFVFVYFICFVFIFCSSWDKQGISHLKADSVLSLPYDIRFSLTKTVEMVYIGATGWTPHVIYIYI